MRKTRWQCSCGYQYPGDSRKRTCPECGSKRKPKSRTKHFSALDEPYEAFVRANGGYDGCWICRELGIDQTGKTMQKDHTHRQGGGPRGILCVYHNRLLGPRYTPDLLAAYSKYVSRTA